MASLAELGEISKSAKGNAARQAKALFAEYPTHGNYENYSKVAGRMYGKAIARAKAQGKRKVQHPFASEPEWMSDVMARGKRQGELYRQRIAPGEGSEHSFSSAIRRQEGTYPENYTELSRDLGTKPGKRIKFR